MLVFEERGKPEFPEKNRSEQSREPTNSAHIYTAVKRKSMRNALVPGRRPRKFPAPKFNWYHIRIGVTGKKNWTTVIHLLKGSEVLQREGFRFNSW